MLRRDMSSSPPLGEPLPRINKFVGESFGSSTTARTIYAGAEEDRLNRDSRVILLIGPAGSGKSSLIDFLCNVFYGATLDGADRYHIANEKFGNSTPDRSIITYVFNDTIMDFRPIVIDTPGTGEAGEAEALSSLLRSWMQENGRLRIDVVGVVFSATVRMTAEEENQLQKTIDMFPSRLRSNFTVFVTGSDGSKPDALLRRFQLYDVKTFKVNTSCLFQRRQDDSLQEHLRGTYWRMTTGNFTELFFHLKQLQPLTFSGAEPEPPFLSNVNRSSSGSSTVSTVIHRDPTIHKTVETKTTTYNNSSALTSFTTVKTDHNRSTEETTIVHPPLPVYSKPTVAPPPPPPPPPFSATASTPQPSGMPQTLLSDIRRLRHHGSSSEDEVVEVVEYDLPTQPEVVVMKKSPSPPQSSPPRLEELPPPMNELSRAYDLPPNEFYKTVTVDESGTTTRFSSFREGTRVSVGTSRYDEVPKGSSSVASNVTTTYSTVAFMNENGTTSVNKMTTYVPVQPTDPAPTRAYQPYDVEAAKPKSPAQTTPVILRTPATPLGAPTLSQQMRHSHTDLDRPFSSPLADDMVWLRSQSTRAPPQAEVVRYVYDVNSRSHMGYNVSGGGGGAERSARSSRRGSTEIRKRESKSLETITRSESKPYFESSGFTIHRNSQKSQTSLHRSFPEMLAPELIHSEDNYAVIDPSAKRANDTVVASPVRSPRRETVIDFAMPNPPFKRNDELRKSLRSPPGMQQKPVSPGQPIPKRRTSAPRNSEDRRSGVYPPPANVDNRDNPEYSIGGGAILREQPGRHTIARDTVSRELREREEYLRQTAVDVHRQSYPLPPSRIYENIHPPLRYQNVDEIGHQSRPIGQGVTPGGPRNDVMIPQEMRENRAPIHVTVEMKPKEQQESPNRPPIGQGASPLKDQNRGAPPRYEPPPQIPPHGYRDQDYGDNWDQETSIMTHQQRQRGREQGRIQGQRPPDLQIGEGTVARVDRGNDPRSPAPPPYPRQYPNTPDGRVARRGGDDSEPEYGIREETTLVSTGMVKGKTRGRYGYAKNMQGGPGMKTTTTSTTVETNTVRGKNRQPTGKQRALFEFKPCSCANRRDCCLNTLFFVVAPLFILSVIIVIIVISVTAK